MHILIIGNPFDGFRVFGPWEDSCEALEWADRNCRNGSSWHLGVIEDPNKNN